MPTVDEDNAVEREKRLRRRREIAQAYREVFGTSEQPTKQGKIILDSLIAVFEIRGIPKNMCDDHGRTDMWQTARRLGHYDVIEEINRCIRYKESDHVDPSGSSSQ